VLAAVDLSELSGDALRGGLELASRLWRGAPAPRIEVVFVLHPSEHGSRQFSEDQIDRFAAGELARFVRRNAPGLAGGARHRVLVGSPRQRLAEEMESFHPDLVILGTHGRSGFQRFLVGSVATDVAARAPRCTLVMPPEAARQAVEVAEAAAQRSGDWAYVSDSAVPVHS
jgi:nucleotide-binding universal stress UspA family protein